MKEREARGDSRLRWKKRDEEYSHGFSSGQVEAFAAICEAMMPPLPLESMNKDVKKKINANQAVESFYKSHAPHVNPEEVAELLVTRSIPKAVKLVKIVLRILSFRLGTLLLCGYLCLDWRWPFILKFSQLSWTKREEILKRWNRQKLMAVVRTAFLIIKIWFFFYVFTWTDESLNNPTWEAIEYHVDEGEKGKIKGHGERPLQKGIIEMEHEDDESIQQSFAQHGLEATKDPQETDTYRIKCDAVIVGSGCGGSVAAANLAGSGLKVVVIEKGNYFVAEDYSSLEGPSMFELYESSGFLTTQDTMAMILAGSTVGGGSVVNWSGSIRTPSPILKEWAVDHGILMFASQDYQLAMDRVCQRIDVTEEVIKEGPQNQILRKGCENLGMEVKKVPINSSKKHYCDSCSYGCRTADKRGADTTWLVDAVNSAAVILSQIKAEELILVDNDIEQEKENWRRKRCSGVVASYMHNKTKKNLRIEAKATVLACGSLLTPPLMVSSGLENPNIGRNLHLHPCLLAWGYFPEELSEFKGKTYEGGTITSMHNMVEEDSYLPKAIVEAPALGPGQFACLIPWVSGADIKERMIRYSRTSNLYVLVRDNGSGEVRKESQINYQISPSDKKNIRMALRRALRILVAAGAVEVGTYRSDGQRIKCKGVEEENLEKFLHTVGASGAMGSLSIDYDIYLSSHQMGSCRMGATEEDGAVDENGESWEAKDLYVCDASVLPTAVGVNPMITIQATAYCISHKIAESMKRKKNKTKNHI